jgi:hypothetical protein
MFDADDHCSPAKAKTNNRKQKDSRQLLKIGIPKRDLSGIYRNDIEAYHQLMLDLIDLATISTVLVLNGTPVKRIVC